MASISDILAKVKAETGVALQAAPRSDHYTEQPSALLIGKNPARGYYCELIGPYMDPNNPDVRIFIEHRRLEGTETVTLLVQDATDDAFLNATCEDIKKYKPGWPFRL